MCLQQFVDLWALYEGQTSTNDHGVLGSLQKNTIELVKGKKGSSNSSNTCQKFASKKLASSHL
jgi:hypothetical protein